MDPTVTGKNIFDGFTRAGTPTPKLPDFTNLSKQWAKITPTGVAKSDYDPKIVSTRACPTSTPDGWLVDGNVAPPTLGATLGTGTYTSAASATGTESPSPTESDNGGNAASAPPEVASMAAGLAGVMMMFNFWL